MIKLTTQRNEIFILLEYISKVGPRGVHIFRLLSLPAGLLFRKTKPVHRNINHVPFLHSSTHVSFYHCWVFWLNRHVVPYSQLRFLSLIARVCVFSCDDFSLYKQLISLPKECGRTIPQRKKKFKRPVQRYLKQHWLW